MDGGEQMALKKVLEALFDAATYAEEALEAEGVMPFLKPPPCDAEAVAAIAVRLIRLSKTPGAGRILEAMQFQDLGEMYVRVFKLAFDRGTLRKPATTLLCAQQMSLFSEPKSVAS